MFDMELKNELLESAIYSLRKGASLLDVLLQAYELGKRAAWPEEGT